MKKKLIASLLTAALALGTFAGCSNSSNSSSNTSSGNGGKLKIGIVQIMEHPSLNTIRESFLSEMEKLGYTSDKVDFEYQNAQSDQSNLNSICQKFVGDKKDMIVAIATPTAQAAAAATKDIPVLFSAVTDPVAAKLLSKMEKPDHNATGTSDAIPVEQVFELAKKLTPNAKTFGFLYNSSEVNSLSVIEKAREYCKANNIQVIDAPVTNTSEVQQAVQSLVGKVDAIYSPIDNTVATAMSVVTQETRKAKLPVYVGADSMVADGGFATVGINYTELGQKTAQMADKVLKGQSVADTPVQVLNDFGTIINTTTADAIGITVPEDILSSAETVK